MGWLVLKVNRDPEEDRWCLWSTVVEAPVFDGTEAEMTRLYVRQYGEAVRQALMERIARAKVHGAGTNWEGDWDGEYTGMIYKQMGVMPREKLGELLDLITTFSTHQEERDSPELQALLEPFDD